MYRGIFSFVLLAASASVSAQQVFKCVNGKQVSYQSDPCPGAAVKAWDATPEFVDPNVELRLDAIRQHQAQRNASQQQVYQRPSAPSGHSIQLGRSPGQCELAKAERKAAYDRVGVRRTFAMSSHWDGVVQKACM